MNKKAFTLIELLAVITILAVIALIAVPNVTNIIKDSNEKVKDQQQKLIVKAAESYANANGLNLCDSLLDTNCDCTSGTKEQNIFCIKKEASETICASELVSKGYLDEIQEEYGAAGVEIQKRNNKYTFTFKENCH